MERSDDDARRALRFILSSSVSLRPAPTPLRLRRTAIFSAPPIPTYVSALTPRSPRRTLIRAGFERGGRAINPVWTHPIIGGAAGAICDAARDDAAVPS